MAAPGWYVDPVRPGGFRYWNGSAWTEEVRADPRSIAEQPVGSSWGMQRGVEWGVPTQAPTIAAAPGRPRRRRRKRGRVIGLLVVVALAASAAWWLGFRSDPVARINAVAILDRQGVTCLRRPFPEGISRENVINFYHAPGQFMGEMERYRTNLEPIVQSLPKRTLVDLRFCDPTGWIMRTREGGRQGVRAVAVPAALAEMTRQEIADPAITVVPL